MTGLGQIALNSAPVFGGAMLAVAAGQFRGPDYRGLIKQDMDLLDRLPPEASKRRTELQRTIDARIDDLIDTADRSRALRKAALSYQGNWRDVVLLVCVVLFTIIWWDVDHSRSNWLPMFVLLIILTIVTAAYAFRRRPPVDQRLEGPIRHQRGPAPASSTSTAASMLGMIVGP